MAPIYGSRKLKIVAVGRPDKGTLQLANDIRKKIEPYCRLETIFLKESKAKDLPSRRLDEAHLIKKHINDATCVIALDESGRELNSEEFATFLNERILQGKELAFIIGSDAGLSESLKEEAESVISLSKLTFSHRIALIVLLEQIYRAFTIISGHPYHRK